jgi:23S rRNA (guanine745-N1)-methyltransferase
VTGIAARPGHALLRCPVCRLPLEPVGHALACAGGHSHDLARAGYVNLLSGSSRRPSEGGDGKDQVDRRAAFLEAGHFDLIADAMLSRLPAAAGAVLEAGAGTGYHLQRVVAGLPAGSRGLGLDLSKAAVHFAARRYPGLAFAVADLWREWPVRSGEVDVVINLFAPKNFAEAARVLRPDGVLACAYPGPEHLTELRREFGLMGIAEGKTDEYRRAADGVFRAVRLERIGATIELDPADVGNAMLMGPNAGRLAGRAIAVGEAATRVTRDIELLFAAGPRR